MPAAGMRPEVLAELRPQERVQRHTMEHIVDFVRVAPMVQILDAPVSQMVDQLQDITRFFDSLLPDPEQIIEVPKILLDDVPMRAVLRDPQLVEQSPGQGGIEILARVDCGCPCDHAVRVPAVQVVCVLRRDSVPSTECRTFQLCNRREIPQCSP